MKVKIIGKAHRMHPILGALVEGCGDMQKTYAVATTNCNDGSWVPVHTRFTRSRETRISPARKHPILGALVEGSHVMSYMLPMAEEPHTECVG